MDIKNHKIVGTPFEQARWMGREITPEIVVLHDTASRLKRGNAARYLQNNDRNVSVHFVIERDGSLVQQIPLNRKANHAGKSHYHGRRGVNGFSIGIEMVNPGKMRGINRGDGQAWYGQVFDADEYNIQEATTKEHGHGFWMPYTEAQIETVIDLLQVLFSGIGSLTDIVPHWYISPGRKTDTNPLFPLAQVKSIIFGREDPVAPVIDDAPLHPDATATIRVPGSSLNMRTWPSFNPNVIAAIPDGTVVPLIGAGEFVGRKWFKVIFDGQEGWVVASYASSDSFPQKHSNGMPFPRR